MSFDRAFLVFAAGVTAAIHVGKLPPALPVLQAELGMTLVQGGFLLSMVQLAAVGLGLAVGLAADGLGLRRVMAGGLVLLAVASALGGFVLLPLFGYAVAWTGLPTALFGVLFVMLTDPAAFGQLLRWAGS